MNHGPTKAQAVTFMITASLLLCTAPSNGYAQPENPSDASSPASAETSIPPPTGASASSVVTGPAPGAASPEQLQELVSPIALYPDLLVARILAASTYPEQVVEAHKWLEQNPKLAPDDLAAKVNAQAWDPSIKSLTQFPQILKTMNDGLAWTSTLGEAYYNQPDDIMDAIQVLRGRAMQAGSLKSTPEQKVEVLSKPALAPAAEGVAQPAAQQQTVVIQPAQPNVVYVPQYNSTSAYGAPVAAPEGYSETEMLTTGLLSFGLGMAMGALINEGDDDWDCDWNGGSVHYNNNVYVSNTTVPPARANYPANRPASRPGGSGGSGGVGGIGGIGGPGGVGGRPRPPHIQGTSGANRLAGPSTRPYDPSKATKYAANNPNIARPTFPQASTLTDSRGPTNSKGRLAGKQPLRASTRPAEAGSLMADNRPSANRGSNQMRGFGGGPDTRGGRTGAFGAYQPGGFAQRSSNRGRSSLGGGLGGGGGFGGGGGGRDSGGGGGRRGSGGGRGGGGGRRR